MAHLWPSPSTPHVKYCVEVGAPLPRGLVSAHLTSVGPGSRRPQPGSHADDDLAGPRTLESDSLLRSGGKINAVCRALAADWLRRIGLGEGK